MSDSVIEFTDANFEDEVLKGEGLVMVDFWAPWCGPCRQLAPTIDELAEEFGGEVKIGKLNTDANQQTAISQNVQALPTIRFFKGGEPVDNLVGLVPKEKFVETINQHLNAG